MMRNLTVILRDLNLGAWRPRQIDKTSLSLGRVVTFALSQTDTVRGTAFKPAVGQSGYELKVRELFESIFRVIIIFFS